ncbi:MAG: hypothetical protein QF441_04430 [Bacteriovoracaceae bacterium]|jgi:hypothetical protein|nr:hypothetical protein [Bacteriovoracaceae bacterium]
MKKLVATLGLLAVSTAGFAKIIAEEPTVMTTQGEAVKVSNLCVNGDKVETAAEMSYCLKSERVFVRDGNEGQADGYFETRCLESAYGKLSHPINYMKAVCNRERYRDSGTPMLSDCTYTYVPAVLPTSYTFPVYKTTGKVTEADTTTGQGVKFLYNRTVTLPTCN